jgi:hypothetical protein
MQTFLPYANFAESATVLDMRRLGKQRVECLQILNALTNPEYGWQNHPATKMWRGHEYWLFKYGQTICLEWKSRGYKDTCLRKMSDIVAEHPSLFTLGSCPPTWIGDGDLHRSHRSNLVRKMPDHYRRFWPTVPDDLEYVWPVR